MKVLIVGASGLVGGELFTKFKKACWQVLGTYNTFQLPDLIKLDFTVPGQAEKIINEFKPDVVIQPAAYANVDGCEKDPYLCNKVNQEGVANIINACQELQPLYVYFSTDYVFEGKNGPNKEDDLPNPQGIYAKVKLEMEKYLQKKLSNYLIIRTSNVFGWEPQGKNFVIKVIKTIKDGNQMKIVTDQTVNPTYVVNLVEAVFYLVSHNCKGIYHISGTTIMSRYEYALLIAEVFKLDKLLIKPITTKDIQTIVKRPVNGGLITDKVQAILPFKLLTAREGLEEMKRVRNLISK